MQYSGDKEDTVFIGYATKHVNVTKPTVAFHNINLTE